MIPLIKQGIDIGQAAKAVNRARKGLWNQGSSKKGRRYYRQARNAPYNYELRNVLNNKLGWNSDAGLLENTLNAAGSVIGPAHTAKNTGEVLSRGERFKNWLKPLGTSIAINATAGGLPIYQTLQTLRKVLAGKGMRFADARIADLEKSIAGATGYKRRALRSQLQRYESLNKVHQSHYAKHGYPGIWMGAAVSAPLAYAAHKGIEWLPWAALDKDQQELLTAQGEKPTTHNQDANKGLSRAASYWRGIKRLIPEYFAENAKHPLGEDVRENIPYGPGDSADRLKRQLEQNRQMHGQWVGANINNTSPSAPSTFNPYSPPQIYNHITESPNYQTTYVPGMERNPYPGL